MQLPIPKDEAIKILKERIQELSSITFNSKVWKDRTILDIKQIFGPLSDQWLQVSAIYFDTAITSQKAQKLQEGRQAAMGLLNSYINFIEQYSKIAAQRSLIKEQGLEDKYYTLLGEYNKQAEGYISLKKKQGTLLEKQETLSNKLEASEIENQRLIDNTILLDNITLKRLWSGVLNLPTKQVAAFLSILIATLFAIFSLGRLIERTGANNDLFDLRTENNELKNENRELQIQVETQKSLIANDTSRINRLSKDSADLNSLKTKIRPSDISNMSPKKFLIIDSLTRSDKNKSAQIIELKKEIENLKKSNEDRSKQWVTIQFELPDKRPNSQIFRSITIQFGNKSYSPNDKGIVKLPKTKQKGFTLNYVYKNKMESEVIHEFENNRIIQINY